MRASFALLLAASAPVAVFAGYVTYRQNPPDCLETCLGSLPNNLTTCDPTDFTCLCSSNAFLTAVTACIDSECDASDIASAEQYAVSVCGAAGVQVTPAPIPGQSTTSGSATPSVGVASGSSGSGSASSTPAGSSSSSPSPSASGKSGAVALSPVLSVALAGLAVVAGLAISL